MTYIQKRLLVLRGLRMRIATHTYENIETIMIRRRIWYRRDRDIYTTTVACLIWTKDEDRPTEELK